MVISVSAERPAGMLRDGIRRTMAQSEIDRKVFCQYRISGVRRATDHEYGRVSVRASMIIVRGNVSVGPGYHSVSTTH